MIISRTKNKPARKAAQPAQTPSAYADQAEVFLEQCSQRLSRQLEKNFHRRCNSPLLAAMRYACTGNGKRFRPGLVYATAETLELPMHNIDAVACAVELIHTYSLIHDDLPAMDNDDMRRGRPTVHKAFDEATAILAGDALHDMAFEIISTTSYLSDRQKTETLRILASAAGTEGMSGGQMLDMALTGHPTINEQQINDMHDLKTGSLIQACVHMTMACADNTDPSIQTALHDYARYIGRCFQLRDDILDASTDGQVLAKPNYALAFGLQQAQQKLQQLVQRCCACLTALQQQRSCRLMQLTWYAGERAW